MIIQSITQVTSISRPRYLILLEILIDNFSYNLKTVSVIFTSLTIGTILTFVYIFISPLFRWYYKIGVRIPKELLTIKKSRFIIVANHRRAIDSALILATLPLSTYRTLLPIRFFTANLYLRYWWQRCFLFPLGSFRAYSTEGKISGVKGGLELSDREQSLFIFPEGKRVKPNSKVKPKIGIAYLAQRRDFTILPVYINYIENSSRKKTQVNWGKPFKIEQKMKSKDLEDLTKYIFNKVQKLST